MDRRIGIVLVIVGLVLLAGCWDVPQDDQNNEMFDHFSDPPDSEIRDEFDDSVTGDVLSGMSLASVNAEIAEVTEEGLFVLSNGEEKGDPAPLHGVAIVGYDAVDVDADETCMERVSGEVETMLEEEIEGSSAMVFVSVDEESNEASEFRLYLIADSAEESVPVGAMLVESGYAVGTEGQFSKYEERAMDEGRGIWACVDEGE